MERAGGFNCERQDCPRETDRDCSLCERPNVGKEVLAVLSVYTRCKRYGTLPDTGGMLDQNEQLMQLMDVIDAEAERHRAARMESQEQERSQTWQRLKR